MMTMLLFKTIPICVLAMLFLLSDSSSLLLGKAKASTSSVEILSNMGYIDRLGFYHVVGELRNKGDQSISNVRVEIAFYTRSNISFDTRFGFAMLNNIPAGRKSPFEIVLLDAGESIEVDHYGLSASSSNVNSMPEGLKLLDLTSFLDTTQSMHVTGYIKNIGNETARNVKIVATYYDSRGDVIAAVSEYLDPEQTISIDPGQNASFDVALSEDRSAFVQNYKLAVESTLYVCKEENLQYLPSDINRDGIVNMIDIVAAAAAFSSRLGDARWNQTADLDNNDRVDMRDIARIAKNVGKMM